MKRPFFHLHPVTRKRLRRFRQMKRAWWSFWVLLVGYLVSLGVHLLVNDVPLYVRYEGRHYFPVFRYYPDDTFTGSGKMTRPDYKVLARTDAFSGQSENKMVFPPYPYGPYQSVDLAELRLAEQVEVTVDQVLLAGNVNIGPDYMIQRYREADFFFGVNQLRGENLMDYYPLPQSLKAAIAQRFANKAAPRWEAVLERKDGARHSQVILPEYEPRSREPRSVRLTLREPAEELAGRHRLLFDRQGRFAGGDKDLWQSLDQPQREQVLARAIERLSAPVQPLELQVDNTNVRATFFKEEVRFPFRPIYWSHPMGLDEAGRDVFARIVYGFRIAMSFGIVLVIVAMAFGILIGAIQGYFGGRLDITVQRLIEIWSALPFLYIMILLGSIYGRSFALLLFVYAFFNWIGISYYMRAEFLRLRKLQFVEAARCIGVPTWKILFKHIFPNGLVPLITLFPFSLVGAIGALTALDYLGFGMPPPTASWGDLFNQAQTYGWAWWLVLYPFLALFCVMLLAVFVGEGVRHAFDPREHAEVR